MEEIYKKRKMCTNFLKPTLILVLAFAIEREIRGIIVPVNIFERSYWTRAVRNGLPKHYNHTREYLIQ